MPTVAERVAAAVAPLLEGLDLVLYDVEHVGTSIRVVIDRDGGLDVDSLTAATRAVSVALDDLDPIDGHYTLEVSSPGLERPLRTPAHFRHAVGADVSIKTVAGTEGERRFAGTLQSAGDDEVVVALADGATRTLRYDEIERARTTFAWGPAPKPGGRRVDRPREQLRKA
jgi:ribosome maturation factor RimP